MSDRRRDRAAGAVGWPVGGPSRLPAPSRLFSPTHPGSPPLLSRPLWISVSLSAPLGLSLSPSSSLLLLFPPPRASTHHLVFPLVSFLCIRWVPLRAPPARAAPCWSLGPGRPSACLTGVSLLRVASSPADPFTRSLAGMLRPPRPCLKGREILLLLEDSLAFPGTGLAPFSFST